MSETVIKVAVTADFLHGLNAGLQSGSLRMTDLNGEWRVRSFASFACTRKVLSMSLNHSGYGEDFYITLEASHAHAAEVKPVCFLNYVPVRCAWQALDSRAELREFTIARVTATPVSPALVGTTSGIL